MPLLNTEPKVVASTFVNKLNVFGFTARIVYGFIAFMHTADIC